MVRFLSLRVLLLTLAVCGCSVSVGQSGDRDAEPTDATQVREMVKAGELVVPSELPAPLDGLSTSQFEGIRLIDLYSEGTTYVLCYAGVDRCSQGIAGEVLADRTYGANGEKLTVIRQATDRPVAEPGPSTSFWSTVELGAGVPAWLSELDGGSG